MHPHPPTKDTPIISVAIVQSSGLKTNDNKYDNYSANKNTLVRFIAVLCTSCTSGFSGACFEKLLKSSAKTSLWMRDMKIVLPYIVIACLTVILHDYSTVKSKGFFVGCNFLA